MCVKHDAMLVQDVKQGLRLALHQIVKALVDGRFYIVFALADLDQFDKNIRGIVAHSELWRKN